MKKGKLIIISGPTACAKTKTSIELSLLLKNTFKKNVEIINFDSLLFYRELNIGTAKPTLSERQNITHHLIDITSAKNPINAADYLKSANFLINDIIVKGAIPILVGGSGFYLRALLKGMYETKSTDDVVQKEVKELYEREGISPIIEKLKIHDPQSLITLHPNDHYRLMRAIEFFLTCGQPISKEKERMQKEKPYDFSENKYPSLDLLHYYLDIPKELHWEIIQSRTRQMIKDGLINEVQALLNQGFSGEEKPLQSIGYKETMQFLNGDLKNIDQLFEAIIVATRQLAKSQRTFFAKVIPKHKINPLVDTSIRNDLLKKFIVD